MNPAKEIENHRAFSLAMSGEYPPMIRFRFATGNIRALAYAYLLEIDYNASGAISLEFANRSVEIKGRMLDALFTSLVNHRVIVVRQQSITDARPPSEECCIDGLIIKEIER
jgi:hypothetical protein